MGAVPMEDIEWRYQTVLLNTKGQQQFNIYHVARDTKTGAIVHILDPDPVQLTGDTVDELVNILHNALADLKQYGVLTEKAIAKSMVRTEVQPTIEPDESDNDITDREYDEDDMIELMDHEWDEHGNVIDLVDFMNRRK